MPSRTGAVIFRGKVIALQSRRAVVDLLRSDAKRYAKARQVGRDAPIVAESKTALWYADEDNAAERALLRGKVHNLRVAARILNGTILPAGEIFSFWKQMGRVTKRKGYVQGRELREGCLIPNIGGGLCQFSNALYDAALQAGCEIVERHAHSRVVPGSLAEKNRDATVFWNYVDLRFRHTHALRLEAMLTDEHLIVRFRQIEAATEHDAKQHAERLQTNGARVGQSKQDQVISAIGHNGCGRELPQPNSCASCAVDDCFRSIAPSTVATDDARTAYLVDDFWQEFDDYLQSQQHSQNTTQAESLLCVPLDGNRFKRSNYAWRTAGFTQVKQHPLFTVTRAYRSRKLAAQGARRQRLLLEQHAKLADIYAKHLAWDVSHIVVAQNLLPHLWRAGHLGGRTFDVLMTALPMRTLQERLDGAHQLHPESRTLADFRADDELLADEWNALTQARRIVTPHTDIARLFTHKSVRLNWRLPRVDKAFEKDARDRVAPDKTDSAYIEQELSQSPQKSVATQRKQIVFPASTLGRKGAYELREAARELGLSLIVCGAVLEDADFWQGLDVERQDWSAVDFGRVAAVVLPAFVEHKPHRLLEAIARGMPVIASTACGLEGVAGVINIEHGDAELLTNAIKEVLLPSSRAARTRDAIAV